MMLINFIYFSFWYKLRDVGFFFFNVFNVWRIVLYLELMVWIEELKDSYLVVYVFFSFLEILVFYF